MRATMMDVRRPIEPCKRTSMGLILIEGDSYSLMVVSVVGDEITRLGYMKRIFKQIKKLSFRN
jgi:hypothetical protein